MGHVKQTTQGDLQAGNRTIRLPYTLKHKFLHANIDEDDFWRVLLVKAWEALRVEGV